MEKKRRAQKIVGIGLLVALIVPVTVLCIPATYTEIVFHTSSGPGLVTMIEPELVELRYIPLFELLRSAKATFADISFIVGYVGAFALAIWLVVHNTRHRLKEA